MLAAAMRISLGVTGVSRPARAKYGSNAFNARKSHDGHALADSAQIRVAHYSGIVKSMEKIIRVVMHTWQVEQSS